MPKILTEVDDFTADITVPEDGDNEDAASIEPAFQKLSNRTLNLYNKVDYGSATAVIRRIPGCAGTSSDSASNGPGWLPAYGISEPAASLSIGAARAALVFDVTSLVPQGATITQVRARVDPVAAQATAGNRMSAQLHTFDFGGGAAVASSTKTTTDATGNAQWIDIAALGTVVVNKEDYVYVVVVENSINYALDICYGLEVTFTTNKKFND